MKEHIFNEIVQGLKDGLGCTTLCEKIGVSATTITNIRTYVKHWGYEEAYKYYVKAQYPLYSNEERKSIAELILRDELSLYETAIAFKINYSSLRRHLSEGRALGGTLNVKAADYPKGYTKEMLSQAAVMQRKSPTLGERRAQALTEDQLKGFSARSSVADDESARIEVEKSHIQQQAELIADFINSHPELHSKLDDEIIPHIKLADCINAMFGISNGLYFDGNSYLTQEGADSDERAEIAQYQRDQFNQRKAANSELSEAFQAQNDLTELTHLTALPSGEYTRSEILEQIYDICNRYVPCVSADEFAAKYLGEGCPIGPRPLIDVHSPNFDDLPPDVQIKYLKQHIVTCELKMACCEALTVYALKDENPELLNATAAHRAVEPHGALFPIYAPASDNLSSKAKSKGKTKAKAKAAAKAQPQPQPAPTAARKRNNGLAYAIYEDLCGSDVLKEYHTRIASITGLDRSSLNYYKGIKRRSKTTSYQVKELIKLIFELGDGYYGAKSIRFILRNLGFFYNHHKVRIWMDELGIKAKNGPHHGKVLFTFINDEANDEADDK